VNATLRTNAFAPAGAEALAFKLDPTRVPGLPAPVPWREIWVYSPRVEGIHLRGGPVRAGACDGPTGATISAPRSSG
jgi:glutamate dehydrogenase